MTVHRPATRQPTRQPKGLPVGGQYATLGRDEGTASLDPSLDPSLDLDGVEPDTYDADLAYLRGLLDEPGPAAATEPDLGPPLTISGTSLPPLVFHHSETLDVDRIEPISNTNMAKPLGGLWLSPGTPDEPSVWAKHLDYLQWDRGQSRNAVAQPVRLKRESRVVVIDTREDLLRLVAEHPGPTPNEAWMTGSPIDFESVAERYDAIWVTDNGEMANHRHDDHIDLYSWEIESVLVLNPSAIETHG